MSATLDYGLKECMGVLSKDCRWNVLTALILHCNRRNRCWPSMGTIASMATSNSLRKATAAKKWLLERGAFVIVPHDKRVDEEVSLPPRQHVYELTGVINIANEQGQVISYRYLYNNPEISTVGNFNVGKVSTIEIINGGKRSIPIISPPFGAKGKRKKTMAEPDELTIRADALIEAWSNGSDRFGTFSTQYRRKQAMVMLGWEQPAKPDEVLACTKEKMNGRKTSYEFKYLLEDLPEWRSKQAKCDQHKAAEEQQQADSEKQRQWYLQNVLGEGQNVA